MGRLVGNPAPHFKADALVNGENKTISLNNVVNYILPVRDPENQPLVLVLDALQIVKDFTTLGSGAL